MVDHMAFTSWEKEAVDVLLKGINEAPPHEQRRIRAALLRLLLEGGGGDVQGDGMRGRGGLLCRTWQRVTWRLWRMWRPV